MLVKPRGYCKGCKDRTGENPETGARDCHITCEKYKQFKRELAEYYIELHKKRALNYVADTRPWLNKGGKNEIK